MKRNTATALLAPMLALATLAAPAVAQAQFRVGAQAGVEHLARDGAHSTMLQARAEFGVRVTRSLDLGGYAQYLVNTDMQGPGNGWGCGALVTLRPMEDSPWAPLAYGSVGYQRAPEGAVFQSGVFFELGGGVAWRPLPVLDIELRGGFAGLAGGEQALTGFNAALAVSLHT